MEAIEISTTGPVDGWIDNAEAAIDQRFGKGFARRHPVLLGAYLQACASHLGSERLAEATTVLDQILIALKDIREAIAGHE